MAGERRVRCLVALDEVDCCLAQATDKDRLWLSSGLCGRGSMMQSVIPDDSFDVV